MSLLDDFLTGPPLAAPVSVSPEDLERLPRDAGEPAVWLTGTGTPAVRADRAGPSTLLRIGPGALALVDCGNATAYQLAKLGFGLGEITHIFITHHHADHNIDLGYLLLSPWIDKTRSSTPVIIGPRGTSEYLTRVLAAHDYDLRVRLPHHYDPSQLEVPVAEIDDGTAIDFGAFVATPFRVDHTPVDEAFGYRFGIGSRTIVISGDTRPCDNLVTHAQDADLLIHEALYPGYGIPEYHTLSTDVGKIARASRVKRLALTHLIPGDLPDHIWLQDVNSDFTAPVQVGRDLLRVY